MPATLSKVSTTLGMSSASMAAKESDFSISSSSKSPTPAAPLATPSSPSAPSPVALVGAGIGRFKVDDVAQKYLPLVELIAPDNDGLEGKWALAEPSDHGLAASLDALGDGDLALAGKKFRRAHFAHVHADGVVGALGEFLRLGLGRELGLDLDQLAFTLLLLVFGLLARALIFGLGFLGLDHVDAHLTEHPQDVLDLLGLNLLRRQQRGDLVVGDIAALLGAADQLLDRRVGKVEQGGLEILILQHLFLLRRHLDLACHESPQSTLS